MQEEIIYYLKIEVDNTQGNHFGFLAGDFYYTIGGEIDPFSGDKTAGGAIKYRFAKGGRVKMSKGGIAEILKL